MNVITTRQFRVAENTDLAEGIFGLRLEPADGQPVFSFNPGQFVMLHLIQPDGSIWAKAAYSIASAPSESEDSIELAVKLKKDFTHRMHELKVGDEVRIQGPYGRFNFPEGTGPVVVLAGGIGITPFRSMIREELNLGSGRKIGLVYSCKTAEAMPYLEEFRSLADAHPEFEAILSLTGYAPKGWPGKTGRINPDMWSKLAANQDSPDYFACGSPDFVRDMAGLLEKTGVDVTLRLHKEMF